MVHYTSSTIDVEGGDVTDSNGLINCGNYPVGTRFQILAGKNGYDIRNDEVYVGITSDPIVIPLNPQVIYGISIALMEIFQYGNGSLFFRLANGKFAFYLVL